MLRDLLELLEVANRWSMTDFKDEIQHHIIVKYHMVQRMVHMFNESKHSSLDYQSSIILIQNTVMTTATEHGADRLRECLEEFRRNNPRVLRELQTDA